MDDFVRRLRLVIEKSGKQQKVLASELQLSPARFSNYVNGHSEPSLNIFTQICKGLGVSADYLLGLSDNPARPAATEKAKADKETSAIGSMLNASVPRDSLAPFDPSLHEEILAYARFRQEEFLKNSSKEDAI